MAGVFDIFFEVKANASEAIASFGTVNKELAKMQKNGEIASTGMLKMEKASKLAGIALVGIGGAFAAVAGVSIKAAIEVQGAQAKLKTAVQDTGVSFANFIPYMNDSVDSMAKLNFTAGDTMTALAQMTAATRNPQTAISMLGATADLAAFQHETLAQAADTVSRAAMGQARGLGDLGVALGKTIPKGATVAQIMQAIADRTHGAAKAAAEADPWKQLTVQIGLLEEKLGTALLPAFKKLSDWIINTGLPWLEKLGKWISNNKGLFEALGVTLAAIWVAPKVDALLIAIRSIAGAWGLVATSADAAAVAESEAAAAGGGAGTVGAFSKMVPQLAVSFLAAQAFEKSIGTPLTKAMNTGGSMTAQGAVSESLHGKMLTQKDYASAAKSKVPVWVMDSSGNLINIAGGITGTTSKIGIGGINSGKSIPRIVTPPKKTTTKKTSLTKQAKGTTDLGTGVSVNVWVDGAKSAAKVATQGAPLTGGR